MPEITFPSINIDYDPATGDIITIKRETGTYKVVLNDNNTITIFPPINIGAQTISIDPATTSVPDVVNKALRYIYSDYSEELINIILLGQRGANMLQKTYDYTIDQPTLNANGNALDPYWRLHMSYDGRYIFSVRRHMDMPDTFILNFPGVETEITVVSPQLSMIIPAFIKTKTNTTIDFEIKPVTQE